jgi:hypothetical protein
VATRFYVRDNAGSWTNAPALLTPGASLVASDNTATVAGPSGGLSILKGGSAASWITNQLNGVAISANMTMNIWASESSNSANCQAKLTVQRCDPTGAAISTIASFAKGTELPLTTRAAQNIAGAITGATLVDGDRIKFTFFVDDFGTMNSGFTFNAGINGPTGAADGDSWVEFTETITEFVLPRSRQSRQSRQAVNRSTL